MKRSPVQRTCLYFILLFLSINVSNGQTRGISKIPKIIRKFSPHPLAGVIVYVGSAAGGEWIATAGYSDYDRRIPMRDTDIMAVGSIGKFYNAVAALKLCETGYINLDDKITRYLPTDITRNLPGGNEITIRHLLSNTTGLFNYENDSVLFNLFTSGKLRLDTLSHEEVLQRYVYGKPASAKPGARFEYSSTNFMLLAMVMDRVLPEGHTAYIRSHLLSSNSLTRSYYRETPSEGIVHHYGDLDRDGEMEDITDLTIESTNWFMGDDGIYASVGEAAHFMQAALTGKILQKSSLEQMMRWNDERQPDYGLGLMADRSFPYKFLMGHSGRGVGMTTDLFYFPHRDMTIGIFCNVGIRSASPVFKKAYLKMRAKIVRRLFLF